MHVRGGGLCQLTPAFVSCFSHATTSRIDFTCRPVLFSLQRHGYCLIRKRSCCSVDRSDRTYQLWPCQKEIHTRRCSSRHIRLWDTYDTSMACILLAAHHIRIPRDSSNKGKYRYPSPRLLSSLKPSPRAEHSPIHNGANANGIRSAMRQSLTSHNRLPAALEERAPELPHRYSPTLDLLLSS